MYSSIEVRGYRGFDSFRLSGLGRVNLLVGANNCGKTSILECIELLQSGGSPGVLYSILRRRGEMDRWNGSSRTIPVVSHLFADHDPLGRRLTIEGHEEGDGQGPCRQIAVYTDLSQIGGLLPSPDDEPDDDGFPELPPLDGEPDDDEFPELPPHVLRIDSSAMAEPFETKMTSTGALPEFRPIRFLQLAHPAALFLQTEGLTVSDVSRYFSEVVLTDREEYVLDALRVVEPAIERIASVPFEGSRLAVRSRSGVFVKLENVEARVPIGSLGDGLWRMLGLALAIANCRGGILLVDEIDTGFHYTVMEAMWRMVSERAAALSVQVFATTHSRDCWESLSAIAKPELISSGDVTIQRIDRQRREAVRFGKEAILAAAKRGLEVR